MAYSNAQAQSWSQAHNANSASIAAGAIPAASLGFSGVMALAFGDIADATDVEYSALPYKIRIVDAWAVKTAGAGNAGNSVRIHTAAGGATPVTSGLILNADQSVTRTTTLDDSRHEFAAAASIFLRFTKAGGVNNGIVYVRYMRVA